MARKRNKRPGAKKRNRQGRSQKKKAIQSVKSLRAKIAALESLNQKLKDSKGKRRKPCHCKKKSTSVAKANTSHPRSKSKVACPPKRKKAGLYKRAKKEIKNFAGFKA
ncbi:MAG: hypothetical protein IPL26_30115 [Leptospiraceae bacterium]|nr:hypothetical protein [Leptospiraceae bacterium]